MYKVLEVKLTHYVQEADTGNFPLAKDKANDVTSISYAVLEFCPIVVKNLTIKQGSTL